MPITNAALIARNPSAGAAATDAKEHTIDLTVSTYDTGGFALVPASLGFSRAIHGALVVGQTIGGYSAAFDHVAGTLRLYRTGAALSGPHAEIPGGTNVAGIIRVKVAGV